MKTNKMFAVMVVLLLLLSSVAVFHFIPVVKATTTTFYSGAGDGHIYKSGDWDFAHDGTVGSADDDGTVAYSTSYYISDYTIYRTFLSFDTSGLHGTATIESVTLNMSCSYVSAGNNVGTRSYSLVQGFQASHNNLVNLDYNDCGDSIDNPTEGADRVIITATGWYQWTLNSTGLGWINRDGWTKLGIRSGWLDCDDVTPTDGSQESYIKFDTSESSNDPQLIITYTGWVSPTGFEDPDAEWDGETNIYDEDTSSYAIEYSVPATSWSSPIILTVDPLTSDKVRFWAYYHASYQSSINLSIYVWRTGEWVWEDVYEGTYANKEWVTKTFAEGTVIKAKMCFYNPAGFQFDHKIYEFDFWEVEEEDNTKPTYSDVGTNTTVAGQPCKFSTKWTDETGLATTGGYIFGTNNTGTATNETWTAFSANPDWSNVTKTLNTTVGYVIQWWIYANDTSNNWNNTGTQSFSTTAIFTVDLTCSVSVTFSHDEAWSSTISFDFTPNIDYSKDTDWNVGLSLTFSPSTAYSLDKTWNSNVNLENPINIGFQKQTKWDSTVTVDYSPNVDYSKTVDWAAGISLSWNPNVDYQKSIGWQTSLSLDWNSDVDYTQETEWASGVVLSWSSNVGFEKAEQWQSTISIDYSPSITYSKTVGWITSLSLNFNPNVDYAKQAGWTTHVPLSWTPNIAYQKTEQWQSTLSIDFTPNIEYSTDTTWQATVTTDFQPSFTWTLNVNHITGAIHNVVLNFLANIGWQTSLEWNSNVQIDWTPNINLTPDLDWTTGITLNWNPTISYSIQIPSITPPSIGGHVHVITDVIAVTLYPIETPDPKLIEAWEGKVPVTAKITIENLLEQPQNVTVYWYVTVYGSNRILANNTRTVELGYPFNDKVTSIIRFNLPIDKNLVPDLTETYKFQTEITYYKGIRKEKTGLSTLFTLSDSTIQRNFTVLGFIIIGICVVTVVVYVQRKTSKKEED